LIDRPANKVQRIAWYLMIACLPITSLPLVSRLLGADSVASPAILFLLVFQAAWLLAGLRVRFRVSKHIQGLLLFCFVAALSSMLSFFIDIPHFKEFDNLRPMLSGVGTLAIGFMFFIVASSYPVGNDIKHKTLQIINISGSAILIWCAFQAVSWVLNNGYPDWMFNFQGLISQRVLYRQRVTGFALEPSWLAHQLNLLYLPYWFASTLTNTSSHRFRLFGLSLENVLLVCGVGALGLTLSRVGFAAFAMMFLVAAVFVHSRIVTYLQKWAEIVFKRAQPLRRGIISVGIILLYLFLLVMAALITSRVDPRMANLFNLTFVGENPLLRYFNELKFGDRVIYWLTGWNIFNEYPIFGVGLGNAGFFFSQEIPSFGWSLVEVRALMYRSTLLLNIKNLWFRLLAETGIIGFSVFIGWLISLVPEFVQKFQSNRENIKILGLMGFMVIAALFFEGFSIDSFAMPYWWISLGLAGASYKE
jgi:O-antigen ligase